MPTINPTSSPVTGGTTTTVRETGNENPPAGPVQAPATGDAGRTGWAPGAGPVRRNDGVTAPAVPGTAGPAQPAVAQAVASPILPMGTNGDFGILNPPGKTYPLTPALEKLIRPANDSLDLGVLNQSFNPLKSQIGEYKNPQDVYEGKAYIPTRDIIGGVIKSLGPQGAPLAGILQALPEQSVLRTPAQEFNINAEGNGVDKPGNRIIFYGGAHTKPSDVQESVSDVDKMAMQLGEKGIRVMKEMVHLNGPSQGGSMKDIVTDGVGGATHGGGFSSGFIDGKPTSVYSDWPANYGRLSDGNETYNAHLFAINYQGGTEKPLPRENQIAYKNNADMWDAVLGAVVPFATNDPDPRHTNYQYNPLDVYDQASMKSLAHDAASLDWDSFKKNHGAFYCAEGQFVTANLGPNESTLLKKSQFEKNPDGTKTKLGDLIDTFQEAYPAGSKAEDNRKHPELGWKHLVDTGKITQNQYDNLKQTGRLATFMEWVPEDMQGWQAFKPIDKEGMIAQPMTVGTLAWSLIHRYMPRDGVASQVSSDLLNAYKAGGPEVKQGIAALLGGKDPTTPEGQAALGAFSFKTANATLAGLLQNPDFKSRLFEQAGMKEITSDADKKALEKAYDKYVGVLMTAPNQAEMEKGLKVADDELRNLKVHRSQVDASGNVTGEVVESTMLYAAPPSIAAWAQNPLFSGGPQVLQYVATAMHAAQEKKPAATPAQ
jgi:hypothetical protein